MPVFLDSTRPPRTPPRPPPPSPSLPRAEAELTADGGGAGSALLGKQVAEAVEAVGKVVPGGEALAGQLHLAADAHEALLVPGLVPVAHTARGDWLKEAGVT